jgi:hypothetical protein
LVIAPEALFLTGRGTAGGIWYRLAVPHRLRFYIQNANGYARFWRIQETKTSRDPFALTINIHGLNAIDATLIGRWPPRSYSNARLAGGIELPYLEMERLAYPAKHLTLHPDGTFHLRLADGHDPPYLDRLRKVSPPGPLTAASARSLQFHVLSDRAERYRVVDARPKEPACVLPAREGEVVLMTTWASGADYDLESEVRREVGHLPVVKDIMVATWDSTKVAFVQWRERPPSAAFASRHDGTMVSFRTNQRDGDARITSYAFA